MRGGYVKPTIVCNPGESFIDIPEFYQYLNKGMIGNLITAQKITITQDEIDCGKRKIVEEVSLDKYNDFEMFSLQDVIKKLRSNLDSEEVVLRVHQITSLCYDNNAPSETEEERYMKSLEMEDQQFKKRNKYADFLAAYSSKHPLPTQNVELMHIHQKNQNL